MLLGEIEDHRARRRPLRASQVRGGPDKLTLDPFGAWPTERGLSDSDAVAPETDADGAKEGKSPRWTSTGLGHCLRSCPARGEQSTGTGAGRGRAQDREELNRDS